MITNMDVDVSNDCSTITKSLKRCNSAPMLLNLIQCTNNQVSSSNPITQSNNGVSFTVYRAHNAEVNSKINNNNTISLNNLQKSLANDFQRIRRYSTSTVSLNSPTTPVKDRLTQLKQEESVAPILREVIHERNSNAQLIMSNSCEDLSLCDKEEPKGRPKHFADQLHISTSLNFYGSSPSPTRNLLQNKQCFSPSQQQIVASPLPSPTRLAYRRSLSPIACIRPSTLGSLKRKMEIDNQFDNWCSPNKRMSFNSNNVNLERQESVQSSNCFSRSISSSSMDDDTPCQSPSSFIFRPVRCSIESNETEGICSPIRHNSFNLSPLVASPSISQDNVNNGGGI